jgi:hypothetical protein
MLPSCSSRKGTILAASLGDGRATTGLVPDPAVIIRLAQDAQVGGQIMRGGQSAWTLQLSLPPSLTNRRKLPNGPLFSPPTTRPSHVVAAALTAPEGNPIQLPDLH